MVIVLDKSISADDRAKLRAFLEKNSFHVNEIVGEEETIFGAVGRLAIDPREVEVLPGVKRVIPISKPYKRASREFKRDDTVVSVRNSRGQKISVGGKKIVAIAGPCAVETREQMLAVARRVAASGAVMLRGGAFKPRSSPYAFQGLGEAGLKLLKEAGDAYGLPIVTEIVAAEHIPLMCEYVDVYQIGARNMQNFELLKRVGELGKPVILKRGLSATIEEWLMAAEYLLSSGTEDVILCERGIRTYEKATRNTLDLSAIPVLRPLTHLPLIVDPSHALGIRDKIPPMALAAIAAGADGILVEVHCDPDKALSDGPQSLYPEQFDALMRDVATLAPVVGREVAVVRKSRDDLIRETRAESGVSFASSAIPAVSAGGKTPVCAFSGSRGAFAEQAIRQYFGENADELPLPSFREIFAAVADGRADYAMVPIENSLAGSVYENYDNLSRFEDVKIAGAVTCRIRHSLLAVAGASVGTIKNVYSHPHGFPQCADFLGKHPEWQHIDAPSTAEAAEIVAQKGSPENAAIASGITARYHNLAELASGIESDARNYTRFVIIAPADAEGTGYPFSGETSKASFIFLSKNAPGALYECLGVFHARKLNLTRLESRPRHGEPWRYTFYADVEMPEGSAEEAAALMREVVAQLGARAEDVRLLGIYRERSC
jgi:3-deoxy-7-phosphoheptulonate synthase